MITLELVALLQKRQRSSEVDTLRVHIRDKVTKDVYLVHEELGLDAFCLIFKGIEVSKIYENHGVICDIDVDIHKSIKFQLS